MTMIRAAVAVVIVGMVAGCGAGTQPRTSPGPFTQPSSALPTASCSTGTSPGFALSLVSDRGGQADPVRASEWFARHGGMSGIPRSGWRQTGSDDTGAFTESGGERLHVVEGPDKTWQVDSGTRCSA